MVTNNMENNTAMKDFLIHIREKRNILTRDWQNGHGHYYVVRIFEMLEAEAFRRLEKEKEQIKSACEEGFMWSAEGWNGEMISYYKDGNETLESHKEEYYNETYVTNAK